MKKIKRNLAILATLFISANLIHTQPQENPNPPEQESFDDDWESGSLSPSPSYSITNYISVLDKAQFIFEFNSKSTVFGDVLAVKSFFNGRDFVSSVTYVELMLYFIDGRHDKLLKDVGYKPSKAGILGKNYTSRLYEFEFAGSLTSF